MPDRKELAFFNKNYEFYGHSLKHYSDYFSSTEKKIKGEATPYSDLPSARIQFIRTIMPYTKIVIVLRNPVERLWSSGLMHLVRAGQRNFHAISIDEFKLFLSQPRLFNEGVYINILKNWRSEFPTEQILVSFYDDLVEDTQEFYTRILAHIGVNDTHARPDNERENKSPDYKMPLEFKEFFLAKYEPSITELSREFGEKTLRWLK